MAIDLINNKIAKKGSYDILTGPERKNISINANPPQESEVKGKSQGYFLPKTIENAILSTAAAGKTGITIKESELASLGVAEKKAIESFIEDEKGSKEDKIEAVKAAIKKGVPINRDNLNALQGAFALGNILAEESGTGSAVDLSLDQVIKELEGEIGATGKTGSFEKLSQLKATLGELGFDTSKSEGNLLIISFNGEDYALDIDGISKLSRIVGDGGKDISHIQLIKDFIAENAIRIDEAARMNGDNKISQMGVSQQSLAEMENFLSEILSSFSQGVDDVTAAVLNGSQFRQMVRVEITVSMTIAIEEFSALKSNMNIHSSKLNMANTAQRVEVTISAMIDEMDSFIMKSDALLYTSMKVEKQLLTVSSSLQNARGELERGNAQLAGEMARAAAKILESVDFKPSHRRAELHVNSAFHRYVSGESLYMAKNHLSSLSQLRYEERSSSRIMLELMRGMGINNESEVSEIFERFSDKADIKERLGKEFVNDNVKAILLKLMTKENDEKQGSAVQRLTDSLFGTQLMNRQESSKSEQTMMFSLPMPEAEANARVIINGKRRGNGIDDDNCSLYFSFETKKLGFTGIKADISLRRVNLTIFNDDKASRTSLEGGFANLGEEFSEWGFESVGVRVTGFTNVRAEEEKMTLNNDRNLTKDYPSIVKGEFDYKL